MTNSTKVTLGILGALAAGVAIGLLIAPEKGSEIRKRIKRTAGDWADNLTHLFQQGKEEMNEAAGEMKEKARSAKSTAEEKVNKIKESFS
jgi:gas vesicle protein